MKLPGRGFFYKSCSSAWGSVRVESQSAIGLLPSFILLDDTLNFEANRRKRISGLYPKFGR